MTSLFGSSAQAEERLLGAVQQELRYLRLQVALGARRIVQLERCLHANGIPVPPEVEISDQWVWPSLMVPLSGCAKSQK